MVRKVASYPHVGLNNIVFSLFVVGCAGPSHPPELTSQGRKLEATIYVGAMAALDLPASLND